MTVIAVMVGMPLYAASATAQSNRAPSGLQAVKAAPLLPQGATVISPVTPSSQLSGAVALRLRDPRGADSFVADVSNPRSPRFHLYLPRGGFAARFGPRQATIDAVRRQLSAQGLRITGVSANGILVSFTASASQVETAFHTRVNKVRLADGTIGQATTSAVELPASIASSVQSVVGLDQLVHLHNAARPMRRGPSVGVATARSATSGPVACPAALAQQAIGGLTDQQVAASYGVTSLYNAGDTAVHQTVDIYELEPYLTTDVAAFDKCYFGASHTSQITNVVVDGGPGAGAGSGEAALDIENVSAIAPGSKIRVYVGPNMNDPFGPLDTWNAIAVADDARQISSSWGLCETALQVGAPGVQQVENEIFQQTAAQGQSVFASSGDDGSDDCAGHGSTPVPTNLSLDDPASQPYVTSVGGTTIVNPSSPPVETVWNNGNFGGAGGGGISESWAMPSWQAQVAVPETTSTQACSNDPSGTADDYHLAGDPTVLPAGTLCRQTPDVSALADPQSGITIYFNGQWIAFGGTSSSAPLWAAMLAEVNDSAICRSAPAGVGFVDPLLYQVAGSSATNYASAFNDVTVGNNDNLGVANGTTYPAGKGYDLATGLGTPRLTNANGSPGLAAQLCRDVTGTGAASAPSVMLLTPSAGPAHPAARQTVTIGGKNFGTRTGAVFFGDVPAKATHWAPSAITVDLPPYQPPPGTPLGSAGSAVVTVVATGPPSRSSAPSPASVFHYSGGRVRGGVPVVDYVSSPAGPSAGGNRVTIVGAGLTGATSVTFGGVAATGITVINDNELSVTVPPQGSATCAHATPGVCQVKVVVKNVKGSSGGPPILPAYTGPVVFQPSGAFTPPCAGSTCEVAQAPEEYDFSPPPQVTGSTPRYVSELGGTVLAIAGSGFNLLDLEWVNIGPAASQASADFALAGITPTEVDVTVPPSPPSTEPQATPVSVQTTGGVSNVKTIDYAGVPALASISNHVGAQAAPGSLTIKGTGLIDVTSVEFVGQGGLNFLTSTSTQISSQTDTSLVVQVPQFFAAPTDVLVCSVTGCSPPNPRVDTFTFTYPGRPVVSSSSPAKGPAGGGTVVTINGSLDSEVTAVHFGTGLAKIRSQPVLSPSGPVVVVAPRGTAGSKVDITITTVGGAFVHQPTSAPTAKATFTYQ